mgnify:CR=1 FL=1
MRLPSVVSLKTYIRPARQPAFTRFNVFLRDGFTCQYCHGRPGLADLTIDHVVPKRMGGGATWENLVCCCRRCKKCRGRGSSMWLPTPMRS